MSDYSYEIFFLLKIVYNYSKVPSSETHGVVEINRGFPTMPKFKFPKMFPKCEVSFFIEKFLIAIGLNIRIYLLYIVCRAFSSSPHKLLESITRFGYKFQDPLFGYKKTVKKKNYVNSWLHKENKPGTSIYTYK